VLRSATVPLLICRPLIRQESEHTIEVSAKEPVWTSVGV
jgi:hypothetical protein